jgi:hypothetical protein
MRQQTQVRTHLSHAAPPVISQEVESGPRRPVAIGLDATKHSNNILRLLESSHGPYAAVYDTFSTAYHPQGFVWRYGESDGWTASTVKSEGAPQATGAHSVRQEQPQLASMTMSDDRTALVKLKGGDGLYRYLSLLRFDADSAPTAQMNHGVIANDGWFIVREVVGVASNKSTGGATGLASLQNALSTYFAVEHGGGADDRGKAETLFALEASLLSMGASDHEEKRSDWSAPVGCLLEVPLATYLDGVSSQVPHPDASSAVDAIHTLDICGDMAAVTLQVGNGAQTNVFVDHLLLGRHQENDWKILSKTFSPQAWPH